MKWLLVLSLSLLALQSTYACDSDKKEVNSKQAKNEKSKKSRSRAIDSSFRENVERFVKRQNRDHK